MVIRLYSSTLFPAWHWEGEDYGFPEETRLGTSEEIDIFN